jgi:outer membrane protein assembly factor BamB
VYDPSQASQPARWLELPGPADTQPAALGAGSIVPLSIGQVFYVDPSSAEPLRAVFQPPTPPGLEVSWLPVGVIEGASDECVLADGRGKVYVVRLENADAPTLSAVREADIGKSLVSGVAVVGGNVFVGTKDAQLAQLAGSSLEQLEPVGLSGRAVWGPFGCGQCILVATDAQQLHCLDASGALRWQIPLPQDELVGRPLVDADAVVVAFENGQLLKLSLTSGEEQFSINVGQPLAAGPLRLQSRLVVAGHDGSLLVVDEE